MPSRTTSVPNPRPTTPRARDARRTRGRRRAHRPPSGNWVPVVSSASPRRGTGWGRRGRSCAPSGSPGRGPSAPGSRSSRRRARASQIAPREESAQGGRQSASMVLRVYGRTARLHRMYSGAGASACGTRHTLPTMSSARRHRHTKRPLGRPDPPAGAPPGHQHPRAPLAGADRRARPRPSPRASATPRRCTPSPPAAA